MRNSVTTAPERSATRGRPRSADVEAAILNAALDVLADHGFTGFSVEAVSARAGVAKTTIYRRFVDRERLLLASLTLLREELPVAPLSGSLRERLRIHLDGIRGRGASARTSRIMVHVAGREHPELVRAHYAAVVAPRTSDLVRIIGDGISSGEIRAGLDPASVVPLLVGPMIFLRMWSPCEDVVQPTTDEIIDVLLMGLAD